MKRDIAEAWIKALESGLYKQTEGVLREHTDGKNSFCCLGVLCNMHAETHPKTAAKQKNPGTYMGKTGMLPFAVRKWAGIKTCSGTYPGSTLADANDSGKRFKTIAKLIRKHVDEL